MKKILLPLLFIITYVSNAQDIAIGKKGLVVNGKNISKTWSVTELKDALGSPDRKQDGYNITHTYDNKGMVIFEKATDNVGSGTVSEFQIHYSIPEPNNVTPKNGFNGNVTFNKKEKLSAYFTHDQLVQKSKGWTTSESYTAHSFRYSNGVVYVYFKFNDDESKLEKVSIGKETRGKE